MYIYIYTYILLYKYIYMYIYIYEYICTQIWTIFIHVYENYTTGKKSKSQLTTECFM